MNRSVLIACIFAVSAFLWVLSGSLSSDPGTEPDIAKPESSAEPVELFKVKTQNIIAEEFIDRLTLQGEIQALRSIEIKAETRGVIENIYAKKGQIVTQNEGILNISIDDRQARLEQAKAELKVRQADLEAGIKLRDKLLLSENQHEQNLANVVAAKASVKQIQVELQQTKVDAAFTGILDELHVEQGDYVSDGDPLAQLVDHSKVIISARVPQQHIGKVSIGQMMKANLLDGSVVEGQVTYIASSADPQTRTFEIEAEADNTGSRVIRFGQSAQVLLNTNTLQAHKISPSYLDLASSGELRVKGVDNNSQVVTHTVEILRNESDGIWVSGIPQTFRLITLGQGFVSSGDKVAIAETEEDSASINTASDSGSSS